MTEIPNAHKISQEERSAIIVTVNSILARLKKSGEDNAFDKAVMVETEHGVYLVYIHIERKK